MRQEVKCLCKALQKEERSGNRNSVLVLYEFSLSIPQCSTYEHILAICLSCLLSNLYPFIHFFSCHVFHSHFTTKQNSIIQLGSCWEQWVYCMLDWCSFWPEITLKTSLVNISVEMWKTWMYLCICMYLYAYSIYRLLA